MGCKRTARLGPEVNRGTKEAWQRHKQKTLGVAGELGWSDSEIGAAQARVMVVAADKVNAQVREASGRSRASAADDGPCGC
jgi:hypothetical protein